MKKIVIFRLILAVISMLIFTNFLLPAASKTRAYYSGEAINYNGRLFIGSTNMDSFELFVLDGDKLERTVKIRHGLNLRPKTEDFFDLEFSIEHGRLYTYLTDGRFLFKYDVSNPYNPVLVDKILDNSNKWFSGLQMAGGQLASISNGSINIWNQYLQVVNNYAVESNDYREISLSPSGGFIFRVNGDMVDIYSSTERAFADTLPIVSSEDHSRTIYNDEKRSEIYICDDASLKVYDFAGRLLRKFTHISDRGYDVAASEGDDYVYFSDGLGVVKLSKVDMRPLDWAYTTNLGGMNGWAMGLRAVKFTDGDKIVVFNNSDILVLDKNLELIDSFAATEIDSETPDEDLWLTVDKNRAPRGGVVSVRGGGFLPYENIKLVLTNRRNYPPRASFELSANYQGRFEEVITIPEDTTDGSADIRVENEDKTRSWSINFNIE